MFEFILGNKDVIVYLNENVIVLECNTHLNTNYELKITFPAYCFSMNVDRTNKHVAVSFLFSSKRLESSKMISYSTWMNISKVGVSNKRFKVK